MIVVRIHNGLGNQLFQYAYARSLSLRKDTDVKIDISDFDEIKQIGQKQRSFALRHFNIKLPVAGKAELAEFYPQNIFDKYVQKFQRKFMPTKFQRFVAEQLPYFDERMTQVNSNCIITGYFQDYRYFNDIDEVIQEEFTLNTPLEERAGKYLNEILKCNAVAIHVRRTDYLTNQTIKKYFPALPDNYYLRAIDTLNTQHKDLIFFCFSDDLDWCKNYFKDMNIRYVESGLSDKCAADDLYLMSQCKFAIIPNSSFGFWGAWLNHQAKTQIIRPKKWHINGFFTPENWISI